MRTNSHPQDITAMGIQLNELRSEFDHAIRKGESFAHVKEIHLQIKELESYVKVLQWNPDTGEQAPGQMGSARPLL